jgi:hypothetical protein
MKPVRSFTKLFLMLIACTLLQTSCEEKEKNPQPNTLTANAGTDQDVQTGQTITLNGSASKEANNQPFIYAWSFTQKPTGSNATLTGSNTATPTFVPDKPGDYEVELTTSNAAGSSKDKVLVVASLTTLILDDVVVPTILEDRIADPNVPDYLANKVIGVNAELTVKPGVVIAFAEDTRLDINTTGGLIAKGEADKKITFTGKMPQKGYWQGIVIYSVSSANELSHAQVQYGGRKAILSNTKSNISVFNDARISLKNSTLTQSGGYGLYLQERAILHNSAANTFNHNTEAPLLLAANNVPQLDAVSVFNSNNGRNVIEVMGSYILGTSEIVWPAFNDQTPYRFTGNISVRAGWNISPGVTIEVANDRSIDVTENGYIKAIGTAAKKINFTGVDKTAGAWNGIVIYVRHTANVMENVTISYAGGRAFLAQVKTSIALFGLNQANLSIKNSTISHSAGYGIHVFGNAALNADAEASNTFSTNAQSAIFIDR